MIPFNELLYFALAAFVLVIIPGPSMIYLLSRSITQGRKAGIISLVGVICGDLFHISMVTFGITAILFAVPLMFTILKISGAFYLLYLAYQAIKPNSENIFETRNDLLQDNAKKLFAMGLLTNVLNPKVALFYLSIFSQFIKPEHGSVLVQSLELGSTHIAISFMINSLIILSAATTTLWLEKNPRWVKTQKWFMASVLTGLAIKMALTKTK